MERKHLILLLKLLFTIVPAWLVWHNIQNMEGLHSDAALELLAHIRPSWLGLAFLSLSLSHFLGAAQWRLLLQVQGIQLGYRRVLQLYWVGLFFNNFMPGNIGGDFKRIYDIQAESGQRLGAGISATIFDRLFGLFFLNALAVAVGFLFFIWDPHHAPFLLPSFAVFIAFCVLFAAIFSRRIGNLLDKLLSTILPAHWVKRILNLKERFYLFRNTKLWIQVLGLSAMTQFLRVLVHWCTGMSLGVEIAVSWYFYFIPLVALISALPISIGGFGPRELMAQTLFARVGVGALQSVVIQIIAYFVSLLASLFGAIVFLFRKGKRGTIVNT